MLFRSIRENRYFPQAKLSRTLFAELIEKYRTDALPQLKESGRATREQHLDYWKERFIGKVVSEVTADLVADARDELAKGTFTRGKERKNKKTGVISLPKEYKRSGATVNRYVATLSHVFTIAIKEWRLADRNPVRDVSKKKESRGRVRFLSDEERDALLLACQKSAWTELFALVALAISTGARRGELIHLQWNDVDLKKARAVVQIGRAHV